MSVLAPIKRFMDEVIYLLMLTGLYYIMKPIMRPHIPPIITGVAALFIIIIIKFYIEVW